MNAIQLLEKLDAENIKITVDAGELDIKAPKGTLTSELKQYLKEHKTLVIDLLSATDNDQQPIIPIERTDPLPLSFAQQRLWFINQLEGDSTQYNIPWALRLKGSLDIPALQKAFNDVAQRHESLRTSFQSVDDEAVQIIADKLALDIPVIDIVDGWVPRYIHEHSDHIFNLSSGPLIKASLLRILPNEHILLINMHHIVSDGWSIGVLNHELSELYTAYSQGRKSPLSPLPIQYADFAHWQRQWLQGEVLEQQVDYWKTQLAGAPALLELPTDRPRPAKQSYRGSHHTFTLSAELTQELQQLSRSEGSTLFMTLLAVFNILLARYSGQTDICVGTPIANRQRQELEGLIGFFINTLILRTQFQSDLTFKELLQQVKATALSAYAHQDIPFEHLVGTLNPERSMSYSPLYQVMFVLQNATEAALSLPDIKVSSINHNTLTAKFDLTMGLEESENGIQGVLEYSTDLFDQTTIERLCQHYHILLEGIVTNPNQTIASLPLLSEPERQQLLIDWNKTEAPYPRDRCIHELFEKQVEHTPNAVAVVYDDQQLTYDELNRKSNQLSHYLVQQGVGPEVCVGLCLERSLEMIIGILGILKAGGAYVPLDPDYPAERLNYMIEDSNLLLILTQLRLPSDLSKLLNNNNKTIQLDRDWKKILATAKQRNVRKRYVQAHNLAYVIYTSGSTGKPKGVMVNHQNVVNTLYFLEQQYPVNKGDTYLLKTNYVFDVSLSELFGWFVGSGRLIILPPEAEKSPGIIIDHIERHHITHLNFAPSMLSVFVEEARQNQPFIDQCPLKYLMVAGEAFPKPLVKTCIELFGSTAVENIYGPTETSIYGAWYSCRKEQIESEHTPIGKPVSNTQLYVVDQHLQPVPIGISGELCIAGAGLARGYLNQPELTAAAFIDNPFTPGSKLYKTGDVVRYLPDGNIEYIGRVDHQVKVRGFRIELGEIENTLTEQEGIREAIVLAHSRGESEGNHYLAAYVVCEQGLNIDQSLLRDGLKATLPIYMVPSFFVKLDKLPLTPNGKVDRKALPVPNWEPKTNGCMGLIRDGIEVKLIKIWQDLLDCETIDTRDEFFSLGGHSILAVQLAARIRKEFNRDLPLSILFEKSTIEKLAAELRTNNSIITNSSLWLPLVAIQPNGSHPPLFCFHPGGGTVFCYTDLAKQLESKGQPLYGLEARGLLEGQEPYASIEAAAESSIRAMQTRQPKGPYQLLGWSSGGTVVFEMAQQLRKSGEKVAFLALLDSYIIDSANELCTDKFLIEEMLKGFIRETSIKLPDEIFNETNRLNQRGKINNAITFLKQRGISTTALDARYLERLLNVTKSDHKFMTSYQHQYYPGELTLFRAAIPPNVEPGGNLNWQPFVEKLIEYETPGNHQLLLAPPNVKTLAENIWNCLSQSYSINSSNNLPI